MSCSASGLTWRASTWFCMASAAAAATVPLSYAAVPQVSAPETFFLHTINIRYAKFRGGTVLGTSIPGHDQNRAHKLFHAISMRRVKFSGEAGVAAMLMLVVGGVPFPRSYGATSVTGSWRSSVTVYETTNRPNRGTDGRTHARTPSPPCH